MGGDHNLRPRRKSILQPIHGQSNHERQRDRADDPIVGLLLFDGMHAVAKSLVDVLDLLGQTREGLQLTGDTGDQFRVDAQVDGTVLFDGSFAVELAYQMRKIGCPRFEMEIGTGPALNTAKVSWP